MGNAVACIFFRILHCVQHLEDVPEATTLLSLGRLPRSKILAGLYLDAIRSISIGPERPRVVPRMKSTQISVIPVFTKNILDPAVKKT